jgi:hypothetical protein
MTPRPRRPGGDGNGGDGSTPRQPSQQSGSVDASSSISGAQRTTRGIADRGRAGGASGQGTTPQGRTPTGTADRPGLPEDRRGTQDLESVPTNPNGLIENVGDQSVGDYLHDRATARANDLRAMRENGEVSGREVGPVNAVGIDRRTGEVVEGVNGRQRESIPEDRLHPVLRERLDQMRAGGPYPQYNPDGSPALDSNGQQVTTVYPHGDDPLRHAEVKVVNELLWRRGPDADASVMNEFQVDTQFPFGPDGIRDAPCCANCNRLLEGTPNNAGRLTHPPGHPDQRFIPR